MSLHNISGALFGFALVLLIFLQNLLNINKLYNLEVKYAKVKSEILLQK